jgi:hypothetical protein
MVPGEIVKGDLVEITFADGRTSAYDVLWVWEPVGLCVPAAKRPNDYQVIPWAAMMGVLVLDRHSVAPR